MIVTILQNLEKLILKNLVGDNKGLSLRTNENDSRNSRTNEGIGGGGGGGVRKIDNGGCESQRDRPHAGSKGFRGNPNDPFFSLQETLIRCC